MIFGTNRNSNMNYKLTKKRAFCQAVCLWMPCFRRFTNLPAFECRRICSKHLADKYDNNPAKQLPKVD